jgi:hypothetical protein
MCGVDTSVNDVAEATRTCGSVVGVRGEARVAVRDGPKSPGGAALSGEGIKVPGLILLDGNDLLER